MKNNALILTLIAVMVSLFSCEKNEVVSPSAYQCDFNFTDHSENHPKHLVYRDILERNRKRNMVGAVLLVKDQHGLWMGASGKADIASNVDVMPCNRFMIASITKVFTATAIFKLVDQGALNLDDPVTKWLTDDQIGRIANADEAKIRHLLNHTSGIPDYFSLQFQLDMINNVYNDFRQEDVLEYAYGLAPNNAVGETYYYSNTNFLLLGMILESASGMSLEQVYQSQIFGPLNLASAYYGTDKAVPSDLVKGYADIYGNGQLVESEFLYKDELSTADGGIAINIHDLFLFIEALVDGNLISASSLALMTEWSDLPEGWSEEEFGHSQNGHGLQHFINGSRNSWGHSGSIFGFSTMMQYFPDDDAAYILLSNTATYDYQPEIDTFQECLEEMFD